MLISKVLYENVLKQGAILSRKPYKANATTINSNQSLDMCCKSTVANKAF